MMVIPKSMNSLVSIIVIIVMIFTEIAALSISPSDSVLDNVSESIIQQENTNRVDPLDNLKKYIGGFNITNKHYWSSLIFTGIYGYSIGVLFLLCGIVYGGFLVISKYYSNGDGGRKMKKVSPCIYKTCDLTFIPLVIFLTILAIVASGIVLAGSARFHSEAKYSVDIIINTANDASETLHNTTGALKGMEFKLTEANVNVKNSGNLNSTTEKLDDASANIEERARKNRVLINNGLKVVFVVTIVIISLNLVTVLAMSVSGILRLWRALYLLVVFCWLITVICWIFFGVYFFLYKFSSDACIAIGNFQQNPYNNSLSSILPCNELLTAKPILSDVSAGIYNLVNQVNANISVMQGTSYSNLALVCNPFSGPPEYSYQPENCPYNTIRIGDIPKVLKPLTCSNVNEGTCDNVYSISSTEYMKVEAYTSSIQDLLNLYPSMEDLLECQLVKDAFSQVLVKHCKPLNKFSNMVWVGMVFLSVIMVLLVLLWILKAHHEQHNHLLDGSVEPHFGAGNSLELGSAKEINITTINRY
ncbi:hypothetical protein Lal_00009856 [Lupinus albus]|uniref:Uncharacterized protein n=1 Tax=Lupinus albus TaxID=3870 RepID=A0A6A4NH07_LUPAL|nr:hypothetical protein Lalb_Chr24g0396721 [Lupinus albus]KAF1859272.1 hypothetical protein Lal_00009856 [Lupinus albus]